MKGAAVKGVCLLADNEWELAHPMLDRLLRRAGVGRDDFALGLASQADALPDAQARGAKVVVALGERALNQTLGERDILRWRGRTVNEHPAWPGVIVVPTLQPSKLMSGRSTEEADALRHPPRFHGTWIRDLRWALHVAQHGFTRMDTNYVCDPGPARFNQFVAEYEAALAADPDVFLSWDIETPYKQKNSDDEEDFEEKDVVIDGVILRVSFCFRPGYAISVPWDPSHEPGIRRLLASRGKHVVWNGRTFDVPVVSEAGFDVRGVIYDGMDLAHLLSSDEPKGLEWVTSSATDMLPWKHLASGEPALYNAIDADAALRNVLHLRDRASAAGMWPLFENHVVRLMPILDIAAKQGNKIDRQKRDEIRTGLIEMRDRMVEEVQSFVPRELFPRKVYKRPPYEPTQDRRVVVWDNGTNGVQFEEDGKTRTFDLVKVLADVKFCSHCGEPASNKSEHFKGSKEPKLDAAGVPVLDKKTGAPKWVAVKNPCKVAGGDIVVRKGAVDEWHELLPFNPNSSEQLKAYMRHFKHPLGMDKKDSKKETADATHLKALHKKYGAKFPIYSKTLVIHKVSKTIGTYTPEPDENDLLHTQFVNSTSTWRLGSRKVQFGTQIQNWGKRKDEVPTVTEEEKAAMKLAQQARKQIIARPGHVLIQIDSSAVEAVMQGYFMNDPDYMNLASQSIHAWLTCRHLGLEFTPANVDLVKDQHPGLYSKFKVTNYLTNFGGGPKLMHDTYPEDFPTLRAAQDTQDALYALLPTLKAYHHAVRWEAHTKTFLQSPWGYRHYFFDVYKRKPNGDLALSKDSKRCVAFKPQNSNAGFQKDNLLLVAVSPLDGPAITDLDYMNANWDALWAAALAGKTWLRYMPTNVTVHDSLCLDIPTALQAHAAESLLAVFTRPIPQMHGLQIGAEVEVGPNWAEMERIDRKVMDHYTHAETEAGVSLRSAA